MKQGKQSASAHRQEAPARQAPTAAMVFCRLQQAATSQIPLRRRQIRLECTTAVCLLCVLFLLSLVLFPAANYTAMLVFFTLMAIASAVPIFFAWRLLSSESQISKLIASDQQQKAQLLEQILSQPHLCHILPGKARIFNVRQVAGHSFPQGTACVVSTEELEQIRPIIHSSSICVREKPKSGSQGLSVIELLGIVAIVSILLSIAIPGVMGIINATNEAALKRRVQTLNFAVEQARVRKYDAVLDSTDKFAVYQYLIDNNFLIKGQGADDPVNP